MTPPPRSPISRSTGSNEQLDVELTTQSCAHRGRPPPQCEEQAVPELLSTSLTYGGESLRWEDVLPLRSDHARAAPVQPVSVLPVLPTVRPAAGHPAEDQAVGVLHSAPYTQADTAAAMHQLRWYVADQRLGAARPRVLVAGEPRTATTSLSRAPRHLTPGMKKGDGSWSATPRTSHTTASGGTALENGDQVLGAGDCSEPRRARREYLLSRLPRSHRGGLDRTCAS